MDLRYNSYSFHIFSWTISLFSSMGSGIWNTSLKIRKWKHMGRMHLFMFKYIRFSWWSTEHCVLGLFWRSSFEFSRLTLVFHFRELYNSSATKKEHKTENMAEHFPASCIFQYQLKWKHIFSEVILHGIPIRRVTAFARVVHIHNPKRGDQTKEILWYERRKNENKVSTTKINSENSQTL